MYSSMLWLFIYICHLLVVGLVDQVGQNSHVQSQWIIKHCQSIVSHLQLLSRLLPSLRSVLSSSRSPDSIPSIPQPLLMFPSLKIFLIFFRMNHMQIQYFYLEFLQFLRCQPEGHLVSCMYSYCPLLELWSGLSRCHLRVIVHSLGQRLIGPLMVAIFIYPEINYDYV